MADEVLTAVGGVRKKVEKLRSAKQEKVKVRFLYLELLFFHNYLFLLLF